MIGHSLPMAVRARLKRRGDQDMIEAERGRVFQVAGPLRQRSDKQGVDEINSGRIRLQHVMVFHRSSFSSSSCYGVDAGKRDRAQPGENQTVRIATAGEPQTLVNAPVPGIERCRIDMTTFDKEASWTMRGPAAPGVAVRSQHVACRTIITTLGRISTGMGVLARRASSGSACEP